MDAKDFPRLIEGLSQPRAYPHPVERVERIETHISQVLLAGEFAYKLKKPLDLGFLDFSTLERRRRFCEEELRLNRRLAADLYLDVVAVTGTPEAPRIESAAPPAVPMSDAMPSAGMPPLLPDPPLEFAVRMRRFPQTALLDRQSLNGALIDRLAEIVAAFHAAIPAASADRPFGTPEAVLAPMLENLRQVRARTDSVEGLERLERLETWTRARWEALRPVLERRRNQGFVRECHGDMHRGNIALIDGALHIFDALEFSPELRWIDTASEIAFLVMDLEEAGETALARRFLNRYLERGGDYGALAVLDFYKVYRAMVRAKVLSIRLGQAALDPDRAAEVRVDCRRYLALAESYTLSRQPRLIIACGVSGSGKSHLSRRLRESWPLIHLRSDLERKRLFGLEESARQTAGIEAGIYFPTATAWTYERLLRLADEILASGYGVLVDASFILDKWRARFWALAARHRVPFVILALDAPHAVLRARVLRRLSRGRDASDADLAVLERQRASRQPFSAEERRLTVAIDTSDTPQIGEILVRIEERLESEFEEADGSSGEDGAGAPPGVSFRSTAAGRGFIG